MGEKGWRKPGLYPRRKLFQAAQGAWLNSVLQHSELCQVSPNGTRLVAANKNHCAVFLIRHYSFYI